MALKKSKIIGDFRDMIRLRTISCEDMSQAPLDQFEAFRELLRERFPALFGAAEVRYPGFNGILLKIKGRMEGSPSVLMAHYDVVPVDQDGWTCDPFGAEIRDGRICGRGTLDTKSTLCGIVEAVEANLVEGWQPVHDLYLSFGGEEETHGDTCREIVRTLSEDGVRPAFVLDEGGAVIPEGVPGLRRKAAMVGIAEKGTANYRITAFGKGGHASTPPRHTAVGKLAEAAVRIENHPFPARISEPVYVMFREIAKLVPVYERFAFANVKLFAPAVKAAATVLGPTFNAMVRTTQALVTVDGGTAYNVLPDRASFVVNLRILPGETMESAEAYLRKIIKDPEISVELIDGTDPTPVSEIDCPQWQMLREVCEETWPDAVFAPYMLNGGTDSRFYHEISEHVYKFSPMEMTAEERGMVHGPDESIAIENLLKTVIFYKKLLAKL